jgi:hypothetical protein
MPVVFTPVSGDQANETPPEMPLPSARESRPMHMKGKGNSKLEPFVVPKIQSETYLSSQLSERRGNLAVMWRRRFKGRRPCISVPFDRGSK